MGIARLRLHRGFSVQSFLMFVLAVLITATSLLAIFGNTELSAEAPKANWHDDTIIYNNHAYEYDASFKDNTGTIPVGAKVYKTPVQTISGGSAKKIFVLYFTSGVDPPKATTVQYIEFDYSSNGALSKPSNQQSVELTLKGREEPASSCSVEGVGWMVCPISNFLAGAMDWLFDQLSTMIAVQPLMLATPDNSMYQAWSIARNIANVAFVITFLIIIFSQLTNVAVSNYGLKKLIPRLIVAAVLVNVSYYISAVAIDIFNILGYSVQDVFENIRKSVFHLTNDNSGQALVNTTWTTVVTTVLAGSGIIAGAFFMAGGSLYFLITLLLGLALTSLFVVIILAARQAIIIILVIVAPLAFVANLLPNTEKLFERWKDLFVTMLVFFPAFSLVFGGSQLAGQLIIMNSGNNIVMLLFGMATQIAPLVITPLILKLSGGLLGKIASVTNDPKKGLIDRNRNWATRRAEHAKQKNIAQGVRWYNPSSYGSGLLRGQDFLRRRLEDSTEDWKQRATNRYNSTNVHRRMNRRLAGSSMDKERIDNELNTDVERLKRADHPLSGINEQLEVSKDWLTIEKNNTISHTNHQRTLRDSALGMTSVALKASEVRKEISDNRYQEHINNETMRVGSELRQLVDVHESSKLNLTTSQSAYNALVDNMKLNPANHLHLASQLAKAGEESAEAAKNRFEAMLKDISKVEDGNPLNMSARNLASSKMTAETANVKFDRYIDSLKVRKGDPLYRQAIEAEKAKDLAKVASSKLEKMFEDYRAGNADLSGMSAEDQSVYEAFSREMGDATARLNAYQQSITSAKYVQQENYAKLFDEDTHTPLSREIVNIAGGVDPNGETRARASAISQLSKLKSEALTNSVTLLSNRAERQGTTVKSLAKEMYQRHVDNIEKQDSSTIEAVMDILAQDGDISTLRDARMRMELNPNDRENDEQSMLTRVFARNSSILKAKGGFDLQANPGLAGATQEEMDISIANNLANVSASQIADQKGGWWEDLSNSIGRVMNHVDTHVFDPNDPANDATQRAEVDDSLRTYYHNMSAALRNPNVIKDIGDKLEQTITIHQDLHARFNEPDMAVDYNRARRGGY